MSRGSRGAEENKCMLLNAKLEKSLLATNKKGLKSPANRLGKIQN
jgi:hypothetical protein